MARMASLNDVNKFTYLYNYTEAANQLKDRSGEVYDAIKKVVPDLDTIIDGCDGRTFAELFSRPNVAKIVKINTLHREDIEKLTELFVTAGTNLEDGSFKMIDTHFVDVYRAHFDRYLCAEGTRQEMKYKVEEMKYKDAHNNNSITRSDRNSALFSAIFKSFLYLGGFVPFLRETANKAWEDFGVYNDVYKEYHKNYKEAKEAFGVAKEEWDTFNKKNSDFDVKYPGKKLYDEASDTIMGELDAQVVGASDSPDQPKDLDTTDAQKDKDASDRFVKIEYTDEELQAQKAEEEYEQIYGQLLDEFASQGQDDNEVGKDENLPDQDKPKDKEIDVEEDYYNKFGKTQEEYISQGQLDNEVGKDEKSLDQIEREKQIKEILAEEQQEQEYEDYLERTGHQILEDEYESIEKEDNDVVKDESDSNDKRQQSDEDRTNKPLETSKILYEWNDRDKFTEPRPQMPKSSSSSKLLYTWNDSEREVKPEQQENTPVTSSQKLYLWNDSNKFDQDKSVDEQSEEIPLEETSLGSNDINTETNLTEETTKIVESEEASGISADDYEDLEKEIRSSRRKLRSAKGRETILKKEIEKLRIQNSELMKKKKEEEDELGV